MNTCSCFRVLSLILTLSLCVGYSLAQTERNDQAKPKRAEVKTDLGNPARLAQPTDAERLKAEQMKKQQAQQAKQKSRSSVRSNELRQIKAPEKQTVRGSSRRTSAEIERLKKLPQHFSTNEEK